MLRSLVGEKKSVACKMGQHGALFSLCHMACFLLVLALSSDWLVMAEPAAPSDDDSDPQRGFGWPETTDDYDLSQQYGVGTTPAGTLTLDNAMVNVTRYRGDDVRIMCEITGIPLPTYRWFKDMKPIEELPERDSNRYSVKTTAWGAKLKIDNAQPEDSGLYSCEGSNIFGRESTGGTLTVLPETNPKKNDRDRDRDHGRDDDYYDLDPHGNDYADIIYEYGNYDSEGRPNTNPYDPYGTGPSLGKPPDFYTNGDDKDSFCQTYRGAACSKFLAGKSVFVKSKIQQGVTEEQLMVAMTVMGSTMATMSDQCSKFAFEGVCYFAVALCDESTGKPEPRRICQDECEILATDICKDEFHRAMTSPLMGGEALLPKCHTLPPRGTPDGDRCHSIGVPTHQCYNDTGEKYKGIISRTASGHECDIWANHFPPGTIDNKYPELRGNHNHCRNPGNMEAQPWCFVKGYGEHREMCDVPKCGGKAKSSGLMYIIGPVIAIICAIVIIMVIVCVCQRRKKQRNGDLKPVAANPHSQMEMNAMLKPKPIQNRSKEFPVNSIRFVQEIAEGQYGKVFRGELVGCYGDNSLTPVMIKLLKDNAVIKTQQDFHQEIENITDFKHPNLVLLLGVSLSQRPQCMIFEYLAHGDLHEYLTMHSPRSDISVSDDDGHSAILNHTDMLHMSTQIAAGMEYLGLHQYIHKDLAARNVLVGDNLNVKIADFGIGRTVYSSDYYRLQNQSQLPVRWMPPEAILYGKFSLESDIWSFGVVLWEIYSYGLQPYYGYANTEVVEMIRGRQILPCPEDCPARIYSLMVECWHEVPGRRPCFKEIHQRLCQWQKEAHVMAINQNNPHMAMNMAHSASGHSSSTHSHPSHHSSTGGPSNNTTTTGLTGSSLQSPPHLNAAPQHNFGHNINPHYLNYNNQMGRPPPNYGQGQPIQNLPYSQRQGPTGVPPHVHGLYRKPSPPGSVSSHSHKSSSLHSDSASSDINYKNTTSSPKSPGDKYIKCPSPTKTKPPPSLNHNKDLYIPETRASDI